MNIFSSMHSYNFTVLTIYYASVLSIYYASVITNNYASVLTIYYASVLVEFPEFINSGDEMRQTGNERAASDHTSRDGEIHGTIAFRPEEGQRQSHKDCG